MSQGKRKTGRPRPRGGEEAEMNPCMHITDTNPIQGESEENHHHHHPASQPGGKQAKKETKRDQEYIPPSSFFLFFFFLLPLLLLLFLSISIILQCVCLPLLTYPTSVSTKCLLPFLE